MRWDDKGRDGRNIREGRSCHQRWRISASRSWRPRRRCPWRVPPCPPFTTCGPTAPPTRTQVDIPAVRARWGWVGVLQACWDPLAFAKDVTMYDLPSATPWPTLRAIMGMRTLLSSPAYPSQGGHPFLWRSPRLRWSDKRRFKDEVSWLPQACRGRGKEAVGGY